ncbi:LIM domain kinase 1-like [Sycon ciliatum]|uniref:LIM domain kinase 1-like n=1 Tax=Sycon ciliatum TaxID=27933 RepID=UPI0031F5F178
MSDSKKPMALVTPAGSSRAPIRKSQSAACNRTVAEPSSQSHHASSKPSPSPGGAAMSNGTASGGTNGAGARTADCRSDQQFPCEPLQTRCSGSDSRTSVRASALTNVGESTSTVSLIEPSSDDSPNAGGSMSNPTSVVNATGGVGAEQRVECSACKRAVSDSSLLEAMDKHYHVDCFRCCACNEVLPSAFYEENGKPYCKSDFIRLFGQKCNVCHRPITGLVMSAGEQCQYHPECFLCVVCSSPIGESDRYTLIEGAILVCGSCSDVPQQGTSSTSWVKSNSIVQLVHVPPDETPNDLFELVTSPQNFKSSLRRKRTKRVQVARIKETDHFVPVRPGDMILELNGQRVKDMKPELLQAQLRQCQGSGFTLTLERKIAKNYPS